MNTIFIDGLGRTISRDTNILKNLLQRYRDTNMIILAQAGKEIEFLLQEIARLTAVTPEVTDGPKKPIGRPKKVE